MSQPGVGLNEERGATHDTQGVPNVLCRNGSISGWAIGIILRKLA